MQLSLSFEFLSSKRARRALIGAAFALRLVPVALGAQNAEAPQMTIEQARCVPTLPSATVGACTLRIRNLGHDSDRLVAVESVVAGRVEIHMTSLADGIMRMRPLAQGLDIPAGALVDFRERGYHLMLLDLNARLGAGETIDASLIFARAGVLRVVFHIDERR